MSYLRPCSVHAQGICFMCTCCARYESICCAHTRSYMHCRASVITVVQRSIISVMLVTLTVSQSCWTCVSWLFEASCRQVMWVCLQGRVCTFSLADTLSFFSKVLMTRSPSNSQTFTPPSTWPTVTRNNAKVPSKPFQVVLPKISSISPPVGQPKSLVELSPGTNSPKKLCRGCKPCPLFWLRKFRRQDKQTPNACPCIPQKIVQFSQPAH